MQAKRIGFYKEVVPGQVYTPGKIVACIECEDTQNGHQCKIIFTDGTSIEVLKPEVLIM